MRLFWFSLRPLRLAIPVALLLFVAACGGSTSTAATGSPSASAPPASAATGSSSASAGTSLTGTVGEGDARVITLVNSTGAPVAALRAGTYNVTIKDESSMHNFHLTGPSIDLSTTVPEVTTTIWPVALKAGTYTYRCDVHPEMQGTFNVK
jgi:hypothetical protein